MNNCKIIALNVNSLNRCVRKQLFIDFINNNNADIYLVSETKFGTNNKFHLNGFRIFRNDRTCGAGGTAIIIKNQFRFKNIISYGHPMEGISIDLFIDARWIRVFSIYFITIEADVLVSEFINKCKLPFIMGGDFNARNIITGDVSNNTNGLNLEKIVIENNIAWKYPCDATCYRNVTGSKIDHFLFSENFPFSFGDTDTIDSFSDHMGISNVIKTNGGFRNDFTEIYLFDKTNIKKMNSFIDDAVGKYNIPVNKNIKNEEIENIVEKMDTVFRDVINKLVPRTKIKIHNIKMSEHTKLIKNEVKKRYRLLKRNNIGCDSIGFRDNFNQYKLLKNCFLNSLKHDTNKYYQNQFSMVTNTADSFGFIKKFTPHKKRERIPETLFTNGEKNKRVIGYDDICNELAERFHENNKIPLNIRSGFENKAESAGKNIETIESSIIFDDFIGADILHDEHLDGINKTLPVKSRNLLTSTCEITGVIGNRPNKKSFGDDMMPYYIIKQFSPKFMLFLTILFNHMLANNYFPTKWKMAKITLIPKPSRDKSLIENWRPISNLFSISKIFEKILLRRLIDSLANLNIFEWQFGFRKSYSTIHPLSILQNDICDGLNQNRFTSIVSLDLKAAFDTVWKNGLILKMTELGINPFLGYQSISYQIN